MKLSGNLLTYVLYAILLFVMLFCWVCGFDCYIYSSLNIIKLFYMFRSSSRGVLTYGLGTLYLTTISSSSQSVYVIPADFANFHLITGDHKLTPAFGIIAQTDVVRDICVVSDILQPLPGELKILPVSTGLFHVLCYKPDGVMEPGLSSITAQPLSSPPRLDESRSNLSVIVIEWGVSSTNVLILYEVEYTLTPFLQSPMDTVKEFVSLFSVHGI